MFNYPFMEVSKTVDSSIVANAADKEVTISFGYFTTDDAKLPASDVEGSNSKKKKASKPKVTVNGELVPDAPLSNPIPGATIAETDYARSYNETNNLIRGAILQADELASEIKSDIDQVRSSKTLKNKYTYITNLTASASSLLSTKINAIKELNSTITQAHNLELNRFKTMKLDKENENDDMKMMDIYSAFINTPVGTYAPPAPNIQDLALGINNPSGNVSGVEMVVPMQQQPLTPEQNRMRMESNPNIVTVVRYDQTTGQRSFDVIDKVSGMSVPNYPRPDNFLLEDTTIDVHSGIARNRNVNTVWPLVVSGSNAFVTEY